MAEAIDTRGLIEELTAVVGADSLLLGTDVTSRGAGIWRDDNIQAEILVRPKTTEQVAGALRVCHARNQTVVTHGGLTGLVEGALTTPTDVVLSTERMNAIESVEPLERTMVVQSGAILQHVQETAAEHGLMFPLDLGGRGSCTIGGNISTNAGGNRVIRYGMMRDMVLGLEAVLIDGTVISSMNRMIKNNAGYDLKQLFVGTEGTLGVVTRAVLRCREMTMAQPTALVAAPSFASLVQFLKAVDVGLAGHLSAFEVMWQDYYRLVTEAPAKNTPPLARDYPFYVLVEAMGAQDEHLQSVLGDALDRGLLSDAVLAQSDAQRQQIWAIRDDVEQTFRVGPVFLFDVSLRIPDMANYVDEVQQGLNAIYPEAHVFTLGHMGDGNLHFAISVGSSDAQARRAVEQCVYEPLTAIGGSVSAEHGIGLEKKPYLEISRSADEIALMRRLKAALDPQGLLNPGKIF